jgi:predicted ATPase
LDEPEAALSPAKQIAFLALIEELRLNNAQFIISTHSPFLMSIPGAQVLLMNNEGIKEVSYKDTEHYQLTKLFLDSPERFHQQLKA